MSDQDKIKLFKTMMSEYMLRKSDQIEADRTRVFNRVSLFNLSVEDYYDLLVLHVRADLIRSTFREVKTIIDVYLS